MSSLPRVRHGSALFLGAVLALHLAVAARTEQVAPVQPGTASHAAAAVDAARPLSLDDILAWKSIGPVVLSSDGRWLAYRMSPVQGDSEVIVRALDGDKEYRFPIGELPAPPEPTAGGPPPSRAADVAFSEDGKWVAFSVFTARKEAERLRRQRRPAQNSVKLVELASGAEVEYPRVRQFAFSGESSLAIGLHRYAVDAGPAAGNAVAAAERPARGADRSAGSADRPRGADLILRELAGGQELTIGSVAEFAFDKKGRWLAWVTDAEGDIGNGVAVRELATGIVRPLDSAKASYEKPTWTEEGDALAVLRGVEDKRYEDKLFSVVGVSAIAEPSPSRAVYDPAKDAGFPAGMTISPNRAPQWTSDRAGLLFGIHTPKKKTAGAGEKPPAAAAPGGADRPPAEPPADREQDGSEETPDLVVWHWQDSRLQSQQQVQEDRDKRFSYLCTYRVKDQKFVRLADDEVRDVTPPEQGRWAVGIDRRSHELTGSLEGRNYQDVYAVDLETGQRTLAAKQVRWSYGQSADGRRALYYDNAHFHVIDLATGQATNITKTVPVSFINVENDQNIVNPPYPPVGLSSDGEAALLYDGWDVWRVPMTSGAAVNLTKSGRRDQTRYRRRIVLDPDEKGIDLSKPLYFETYGEWTKKGGIARVDASGGGARTLLWDDASFLRVVKAKRADVVAFSRESWKEFPDVHVADMTLANARRVTDGQTQVGGFEWTSGARLIDYTSDKGRKLQGALFLPANYEPGKSYPTIVYIYERLSDQLNRFAAPTANGFNRSVYTSNGYAVLMPDISYTINDPGMSAVWCVLPALKAATATGIVDPTRVGLHGHSWGGYQTSFLVTQTSAFKAAVAGAPLTNMVSMYSLIYKNTGGGNMAIFESSQGRFKGGYWDNWEAYVRNSPIAFARNVTTPLLLLHNDKDGAVDFTQGIEYYNTLRRLKKPVVLLEYVGENHGLRKPVNQQDYTVRMKEFFDHHLKGAKAPTWWSEGVPRLQMDEHLRERKEQAKPKPGTKPTPTAAPGGDGR